MKGNNKRSYGDKMKRNKKLIFIITCLVFTISYSSLFAGGGFDRQLNIFVEENNLSYEDIEQIILELNQIEGIKYNKQLKKGLRKIGKLKEKKIERTAFSIKDIDYKRNISYNFFNNRIFENRNMEISSILMLKMGENILKLRE